MPPRQPSATEAYMALAQKIRAKTFAPIYFLMGEEPFYIDRLSNLIVNEALDPAERDFNLHTYFGAETSIDEVLTAARGFPFGGQRVVVLVREAQQMKRLEQIEVYLRHPSPTTVLIFCHPGKSIDRRTKYAAAIDKQGVLFEAKKLYDSQLPTFITAYLRDQQTTIAPDAATMLADCVGANLSRMTGELDKLLIALPEGQRHITMDHVRRQVGLSREFTIFELLDALDAKNVAKTMQIARLFAANPKEYNLQKILPLLFKHFAQLMIASCAPDKSERGLCDHLEMRDWQVRRSIMPALKNYSAGKLMQIITAIRRIDARSKGIDDTGNTSQEDLLRELLHFILH